MYFKCLTFEALGFSKCFRKFIDNAIEAAIEDPESKSVCLEIKDECDHCNIYVYNTGAPITNKRKYLSLDIPPKARSSWYGLF